MNSCLVRSYAPNDWVQIAPLLADWPFKPLARLDRWPQPGLVNFTCERVHDALGNKDGASWVALRQERARGLASLTMLPWDSDQLDMGAARVDYLIAEGTYEEQRQVKEMLIEQVCQEAHDRGVRHLSARVDASDLPSLHALEGAGFITADTLLTLVLDLSKYQFKERLHDFRISMGTPDDAERVADLARTAFIYDRFHADPSINPVRADELHATWLRNSCTGKNADAVLLAEDQTGLLGFMTCTLQHHTRKALGRMVGTHGIAACAEAARGRGVASALLLASLDWYRDQGCEIVDAGTQVRNFPCLGLYQKCGFRIVGSSISLRRLL